MEFEGKVILHTVGHFFEGYYAAQFLFGGCSRETKIWKILQSHVWNIRHHLGISIALLCTWEESFREKSLAASEATIKFFFITLLNFIRHAFAVLDPSSPLSSNYGLVKVDFFLAVINIIMLQLQCLCSRPLQTLSLFCGDDRVPCDAIMACSINDFWGLDGSDHLHPEQPFAASLPQSSFKFLSPESSDEYLNEPALSIMVSYLTGGDLVWK